MNERFLSKAKKSANGKWVTGYYFHDFDNNIECMNYQVPGNYLAETKIELSTLCQCTGLKDKNGVLIFEGDELDINGEARQIMYIDGGYGYTYYGWINLYSKAHLGIVDIEVIGNIHD